MMAAAWKPQLVKLPVFGDSSLPTHLLFPKPDDLQYFPYDKKIKLKTITWKNCSPLFAMQLTFTGPVASPFFWKDEVAEKGEATNTYGATKSVTLDDTT